MTKPKHEMGPNVLPEYDYPVPFVVRNTFIDTTVRPVSLDEFMEERRVHSCPVGPPPGLCEEDVPEAAGQLRKAIAAGSAMIASAAEAAAAGAAVATAAARGWRPQGTEAHIGQGGLVPRSPAQGAQVQTPVLCLADALAEPEVGSPELPTIGSKGHRLGTCKPCAFYHTKGCGNGAGCIFCHLCPAGEKKRRQKDKHSLHREFRRMHLQL